MTNYKIMAKSRLLLTLALQVHAMFCVPTTNVKHFVTDNYKLMALSKTSTKTNVVVQEGGM